MKRGIFLEAGRVVHVADAVLAGFAVLVARCYFIFELNMRSQMMIFFTLKNLLVVLLQVYRLGVLWV